MELIVSWLVVVGAFQLVRGCGTLTHIEIGQ